MSIFHGLNIRQKVAAAGLSIVALGAIGATGNSYLEKTRNKPSAHSKSGADKFTSVSDSQSGTSSASSSKSSKFRPAYGSVNINTATEQELDALPGVGPSTAKKIVEYRTAHNGFSSIDELDEVKGIGPKKLEEMRPYCRL